MVLRHAVECNDARLYQASYQGWASEWCSEGPNYDESLRREKPRNSGCATERYFVTGGPSVAHRGSGCRH